MHKTKRYTKRALSRVEYIVVHHSGTTSGSPKAFARYQINHNDWPGIGYHFVIDTDGSIYVTNPIDVLSYHVLRNNTKCIGICMVGNFNKTRPSVLQLNKMDELIGSIQMIMPDLYVKGHRDFKDTSCPGQHLYDYLTEMHDLRMR